MATEQKTQLEKANDVLTSEIAPNVSTEDRQAAFKELVVSEFTLIQYLKGRGKNLDMAIKLISFFRNRINKREKILVA
jgi:hypothetical protein